MARRLTILLYAVAIGLLVFSAGKWIRALQRPDEVRPFVAVDEPFDFEALTESDGFTLYGAAAERVPGALVAIFTMPVDPCIDCFIEVHAFRAMLLERGLSGREVHPEIVVVGSDSSKAKHFVKTTDLEQPIWYGSDPVHDAQLHSFGRTSITHQMLLVDPVDRRIFFRSRLALSQGSPPEVREDVLWEAQRAFAAYSN
ncbi:MAG: hypothetical protein OXU68_15360 [Bacteroidota bacterium]|nr:hypothetical protein [Bacteroidota bacterium]